MFQLFTDTDTDITPEIAKKYDYKLISMPYSINGKEVYPYEDFNQFDYKTFYNTLRKGALPKTFGLSPEKYEEYFEPTLKEGKDILYVHFSSAMSGTFNAMKLAWENLSKKYPERKLYTIDTLGITICSYNIVCEIGDMVKNGANVDNILEWSKNEIDKFAVYFYADNLKFFAHSGRVSNFSATMGNLIGIRPIINMNAEGIMNSVAKARGRHNALNALVDYVTQLQDDLKSHRIIIGHTDAYDLAVELKESLMAKFGKDLNIEIISVNPTAGSHCGPDTIGVCFHAIHR